MKKLAIANRGEVAVRIIKACKELNIKSILLHSEIDVATRAYRMADETYCIGPAASKDSYLSIEANISGAKSTKADMLHPGFGFLSENANFAKACLEAGITFVGPSEKSISLFGDKISAKNLVEKVGVPCIPGYQGEKQDIASLSKEVKRIGYPVLVKAASGGGGRGMKVVRKDDEIEEMISSAQREAKEAFGDERVFLEKYLEAPKHIEFQIFGDHKGNIYHLFERECSIQRRHQKIIEEAPSPSLTKDLRAKIADAAVKIAKESNYQGAGTVEFLLENGEFFFLEMNTRLQVEHPVTEMICNKDLVKAQILTAMGEDIHWSQEQMQMQGHSIECRLYAEDAYKGGMPSSGKILAQSFPEGEGRRFEYGFEEGDTISPYYDSMMAKLIVKGIDRETAIQRMLDVLDKSLVFGVHTNIPYLKAILKHSDFQTGIMTTKFIEEYFSTGIKKDELSSKQKKQLEELYFLASKKILPEDKSDNPWKASWSIS